MSPINDDGLVGYWQFDEGMGTTTSDLSGNGNSGTLVNSPTWTTSAKVGDYALDFDGVDDYVSLGTKADLRLTDTFTISAWFKRPEEDVGGAIFGQQDGFGTSTFISIRFFTWENNPLAFQMSDGESFPYELTYGFTKNTWHHVTVTFKGSENKVEIYKDGNLETYSTGFPNEIYDNFADSRIGVAFGSSNPFEGIIDDVRIYNRALSASEIEAMYNSY